MYIFSSRAANTNKLYIIIIIIITHTHKAGQNIINFSHRVGFLEALVRKTRQSAGDCKASGWCSPMTVINIVTRVRVAGCGRLALPPRPGSAVPTQIYRRHFRSIVIPFPGEPRNDALSLGSSLLSDSVPSAVLI